MSFVHMDLPTLGKPSVRAYSGRHVHDTHQGEIALDNDFSHRVILGTSSAEHGFRAGVMIADEDGQIEFKNYQAANLLDEGNVISVRHGRLRIDRSSVQRSFELLFKRVVSWDGNGERSSEVLGIPDRSGVMRYALRAIAVTTRDQRRKVVISIIDITDGLSSPRATVAAVFRLTERESEFVELFSEGLSIVDIAAAMSVTLNTARVHLRRIFVKTNCCTQTALMRLLGRLAIIA